MCLPSWLYRSLHSARLMGHCFFLVGALLSFQNHLWLIGFKKKKKCATKFRTNILCKNSKTVGKALAAAWNLSQSWHFKWLWEPLIDSSLCFFLHFLHQRNQSCVVPFFFDCFANSDRRFDDEHWFINLYAIAWCCQITFRFHNNKNAT
jgi:hypothetical protein